MNEYYNLKNGGYFRRLPNGEIVWWPGRHLAGYWPPEHALVSGQVSEAEYRKAMKTLKEDQDARR